MSSKRKVKHPEEAWKNHDIYANAANYPMYITRSQSAFNRITFDDSDLEFFADKKRHCPPNKRHFIVAMKGEYGGIPRAIVTRSTASYLKESQALRAMLDEYKKLEPSSQPNETGQEPKSTHSLRESKPNVKETESTPSQKEIKSEPGSNRSQQKDVESEPGSAKSLKGSTPSVNYESQSGENSRRGSLFEFEEPEEEASGDESEESEEEQEELSFQSTDSQMKEEEPSRKSNDQI